MPAHRTATARRHTRRASLVAVLVGSTMLAACTDSRDTVEPRRTAGAPAECVQQVAEDIRAQRANGFLPMLVTVHDGRIDVDDGITRSFGYQITATEALAGDPLPPDPATVWYPVPEAAVPHAGRYLLLLRRATRPRNDGGALYDMSSEQVYRMDGRTVRLPCDPSLVGEVPVDVLRVRVAA